MSNDEIRIRDLARIRDAHPAEMERAHLRLMAEIAAQLCRMNDLTEKYGNRMASPARRKEKVWILRAPENTNDGYERWFADSHHAGPWTTDKMQAAYYSLEATAIEAAKPLNATPEEWER